MVANASDSDSLVPDFSRYVIAPNAILVPFGNPPTSEVWIRIVGFLALNLAYYSFRAARAGLVPFFRWSVHGRLIAPAFFVAFVVLGLARPTLVLFAAVDVAAAIWTHLALRAERVIDSRPVGSGTRGRSPRGIREDMERNVPTPGS